MLLFRATSCAQNSSKLTNSGVVKMVKAKLSDELIIDEISNSQVEFHLGNDSVQFLKSMKISDAVLDAMQKTQQLQHPEQLATPSAETTVPQQTHVQQADTVTLKNETPQMPENVKPQAAYNGNTEKSDEKALRVDDGAYTASSYVIPLDDLVRFFGERTENTAKIISIWNQQVVDTLKHVNELNDRMRELDSRLNELKNADATVFSAEINSLKAKLNAVRSNFKLSKANLNLLGAKISKQLETLQKEEAKLLTDKFDNVAQQVKSDAESIENDRSVKVFFPVDCQNYKVVSCIYPATPLLYWFRNEALSLRDLVKTWDAKAVESHQLYLSLNGQLVQAKSDLNAAKAESKKNKARISELKKKIDTLEKGIKNASGQMEKDGKELSGVIKQMKTQLITIQAERYNDAAENISFMFQYKLNL